MTLDGWVDRWVDAPAHDQKKGGGGGGLVSSLRTRTAQSPKKNSLSFRAHPFLFPCSGGSRGAPGRCCATRTGVGEALPFFDID